MSQVIKLRFLSAIATMIISAWSAPSYASTDYYYCLFETGTDFGENIEFGYDLSRNIILLQQHQNGVYQTNFTFAGATQEGGMLQFVLEHWIDGSVAMRESHSLNFENMILDSSQDFYDEDGGLAGHGQTAIASCLAVSSKDEAGAAENPKPLAETKRPAEALGTSEKAAEVTCHTQQFGAEGAKSGTWCVVSMLPGQKEYSYGPENLIGEGAWCEGEIGYGVGVGVEVSFQPFSEGGTPPVFDRLMIANGYDKTTKTFIENSRVKQIEIKTDTGQTWVRTLRDETGTQEVLLGEKISPNGILITILDVYKGQKYDDTCLSFVMADFGF
ncbi:NADase-type glycan-binding domain-containing protein [Maritalea sp.]|uniref:NADase-type glycan-binding domain-containing protein n=1 Tax=Maritalea sp. TaxID=2003361 RepID=UPI003EF75B82